VHYIEHNTKDTKSIYQNYNLTLPIHLVKYSQIYQQAIIDSRPKTEQQQLKGYFHNYDWLCHLATFFATTISHTVKGGQVTKSITVVTITLGLLYIKLEGCFDSVLKPYII